MEGTRKTKIDLPYSISVPPLGRSLEDTSKSYDKEMYAFIFIASVFPIAQKRKWPRFPSKTNG